MPALSSTMEEGTIVQWLKEVGDRIEVGHSLLAVLAVTHANVLQRSCDSFHPCLVNPLFFQYLHSRQNWNAHVAMISDILLQFTIIKRSSFLSLPLLMNDNFGNTSQ